jgi:plastocyanin
MKRVILPGIIILGTILAGVAIYFGVTSLTNQYLGNRSDNVGLSPTVTCRQKYTNHVVTITNDIIAPQHVQATLCDTLTITNNDDKKREIAFGVHSRHTPYDGVLQEVLAKSQSLTVTLNQTGTYTFHDHFQDGVAGDFTVTN